MSLMCLILPPSPPLNSHCPHPPAIYIFPIKQQTNPEREPSSPGLEAKPGCHKQESRAHLTGPKETLSTERMGADRSIGQERHVTGGAASLQSASRHAVPCNGAACDRVIKRTSCHLGFKKMYYPFWGRKLISRSYL